MAGSRLSVWPALPPGVWLRPAGGPLPWPLEDPACRLRAWGRHAVLHGTAALGLGPGTEVLAPAWHHGSEIEALGRAGLACRFYDVGASLEPDEAELESLLGPRVRVLYLIHYLGFPQASRRWRRWCDEHGLLLIEDAAQAWLATDEEGRPVGSSGHLAFFCLYKSVGLPEGAAMIVDPPPPERTLDPRVGIGALARRHGAWVAARSDAAGRAVRAMRDQPRPYDPEKDFALRDPSAMPWSSTPALLARLDANGVAARRRAHHRLLLDELGDRVPPPFRRLPEGASPLALPIEAPDKAELLARLDRAGIKGLDFWSAPHPSLPVREFPGAAARRASLVALPVHQELRPRDLERIARAARPPGAPRRRAWTTEVLDDLEAARPAWEELAAGQDNIFATWQWAATWWRHFGRGRRPRIVACRRSDGRVAAILPLYEVSLGPVRALRFVGQGPADELGPICRRDDRPRAAEALRRAAGDLDGRVDLLLLDQVPASEGWTALTGGTVLRSDSSPVIRFRGRGWEEWLRSRSRNFRDQVRRRERRLAREHDLGFRLCEDADRLPADLETMIDLHEARWAGRSESFAGARRAFHHDFAAQALERGWCRLWIMELDGAPVAAWYGFRFGGAESYYQAGRDPRFERGSVGFVMLAHTIRCAVEEGVGEYRLLRGGEEYKSRFAYEDPGLETIGVGRTAAGRALIPALRGSRRLPERARRGLGRKLG